MMPAVEAVATVLSLLNAATTFLANATQVSQMIQSAQAAGRDLNDAEMAQIKALDDAARVALASAITKAGG